MFAVQKLSTVLRPGRAEDGPPYGKPGTVWSTLTVHSSRADAEAGLARILAPTSGDGRTLDPDRYRIKQAYQLPERLAA